MVSVMKKHFGILLVVLLGLATGQSLAEEITFCVKKNGIVRVPVKPDGQCRQRETPLVIASDDVSVFKYKVGDTGPAGGIIFFVDYHGEYPGFDYLEAAPEDLPGTYRWCSGYKKVEDASGWAANALGRGQANTNAIIAAGCIEASDAARAAKSYLGGGKTDWFLPSLGELKLMYSNLRQTGAGAFAIAEYWSSVQENSGYAWLQSFFDGNVAVGAVDETLSVRPVRAF